jgi:hypothetical protein
MVIGSNCTLLLIVYVINTLHIYTIIIGSSSK